MTDAIPLWTAPFERLNPDGQAPLLLVCDHASAAMPVDLQGLGLSPGDRLRHIGWDPGAAAITRHLCAMLDAPAILCGTSRLVVDCNRWPHDPKAIPNLVDQTPIPGNQGLTEEERSRRFATFHTLYHQAVAEGWARLRERVADPLLVSIHSMTDRLRDGPPRPWPIAISHDRRDGRMALPLLQRLRVLTPEPVGDNEPYDLDPAEDFTVPHHAIALGARHVQVEFRQDRLIDPAEVQAWASLFAEALRPLIPG